MRSTYTFTILLLTCFMFSNSLKLKAFVQRKFSFMHGDYLETTKEKEGYMDGMSWKYRLVNQKDGNLA